MAKQTQKQKQEVEEEVEVDNDLPPRSEKHEDMLSDMDDLLDEIDGVLETNAEEFVNSYVQKGGQ